MPGVVRASSLRAVVAHFRPGTGRGANPPTRWAAVRQPHGHSEARKGPCVGHPPGVARLGDRTGPGCAGAGTARRSSPADMDDAGGQGAAAPARTGPWDKDPCPVRSERVGGQPPPKRGLAGDQTAGITIATGAGVAASDCVSGCAST